MKRTIVVGDIHGCFDEFQALLAKINIKEEDEIFSLGDIIDRGPKSKEVYQFFKHRPNSKVLMGNHERKHLNGVLSYSQEIVKVQFGADYEEFRVWTKSLDYYHETEDAIIVHAFFEHDKSLEEQKDTVLCGSTSGSRYLEKKYGEGNYWTKFYEGTKPIIYGHHVVGDEPKIINNTYGIDTGACHKGFLTAIELPGFIIHQVEVNTDYWKEERVKWQVPVLKSKQWANMKFDKIKQAINKLRYIENEEVKAYLDKLENWIDRLDELIVVLLEKVLEKKAEILEEVGNKKFNFVASQYPFKVFLFKARGNNLTRNDLLKSLDTPAKRLELAERLGVSFQELNNLLKK